MSNRFEDRVFVAKLLRNVRIGVCSVRVAMLNYPKDTDDESLIAAYHALIHYEADEDLRRRDELYKDEQDDYLEFLANTLDKGEDFPQNIIDNYIDDNMPNWAKPTIKKLVDKGVLVGTEEGLNLNTLMMRILVILDRIGIFDK